MPKIIRPFVVLWLICGGFSSLVSADIYNRQFLPVGERQAFMSNVGVGHASDGGAGYYNPSGLADLDRNQIAVTANTYFIYDIKFDSLVQVNSESVPYEASGFNMIPMAANAAWGKGDWKVGLSIMLPDSFQVQNRAPVDTSLTEGQILQSQLSQDLWGGISLARRLDDRWSIGATVWGIQHSSVEVISLRVLFPASANTVVTSSSRQSMNVLMGSVTLGVGYRATSSTRLGLRVQSPSFKLFGTADNYRVQDEVIAGTLTSTELNQKRLDGNYVLPLDATFGIAQQVGPIEFLLDMSVQMPIKYNQIPKLGDETEVATKLAPRWSFGTDWAMSQSWSMRSGFFYTPSALRKLEAESSESDIDLWGASLGLLWRTGQIETSGGLFLVRGTGKSAPAGTTQFFDASISGYGALLASSYTF